MAISSGGDANGPMSEINTTPLVDVMLVLLIIFLIAIPVVIQTVDLELPVVKFEPTESKNTNILLAVTTTDAEGRDPGEDGYSGAFRNGDCRVYINTRTVDQPELIEFATKKWENELKALGGEAALIAGDIDPKDLPEVHIRGDLNTPYRCIGSTIYSVQISGFTKIGFVSSPINLNTEIQ
jgi:biopolymer transport protein ExbD